jgi:hypothetical protein
MVVEAASVSAEVGIAVAVSVTGRTSGVLLANNVGLGRAAKVCAIVVASKAAEVAARSIVGVGLVVCCRKAGIQALRANDMLSASSSILLIVQLLRRNGANSSRQLP